MITERHVDLQKSTNVRFPKLTRTLMQTSARIAPNFTARKFADGFVTPLRAPIPEREIAWTRGAARYTVRSGAYELAVRSIGLGGPQILLVHGWSGRGSQLGAFIDPLVQAGFEVNWFDLPAHGDSSGKRAGLVHAVEAVQDVAEWLGGADTVIAHSMGAAATTLAAADDAPIDRMVYLAPPDDVGHFLWVIGRLIGLPEPVIGDAQRSIEERFDIRFEDLLPTAVARELEQPLLALHDRGDREVHLEEVERLVAAWPRAELRVTDGLGHRRILRDPGIVAQVVEYIAGTTTGRRRAA